MADKSASAAPGTVNRLKEWPKTGKPGHYKGDRPKAPVMKPRAKAPEPAPAPAAGAAKAPEPAPKPEAEKVKDA